MKQNSYSISGQLVDIIQKKIYPAEVVVENGTIVSVNPASESAINTTGYILPGFIDSHVHIESSMLIPSEFAKLAVVHGTVGTVSDPHEIASMLNASQLAERVEAHQLAAMEARQRVVIEWRLQRDEVRL